MHIFPMSAAIALMFGAAAQAATFRPNQSFSLDLDTQSGSFSQWRAEDMGSANAVRTQVTFARLGSDKKWAPSFHVSLVSGTERAVFDLTAFPGKKPMMAALVHWRDGKEVSREIYVMTPEVGETFGLDLDWLPNGAVTMLIRDKAAQAIGGYERHEVRLESPPTAIEVSGSTGEVVLKPLQLGETGP